MSIIGRISHAAPPAYNFCSLEDFFVFCKAKFLKLEPGTPAMVVFRLIDNQSVISNRDPEEVFTVKWHLFIPTWELFECPETTLLQRTVFRIKSGRHPVYDGRLFGQEGDVEISPSTLKFTPLEKPFEPPHLYGARYGNRRLLPDLNPGEVSAISVVVGLEEIEILAVAEGEDVLEFAALALTELQIPIPEWAKSLGSAMEALKLSTMQCLLKFMQHPPEGEGPASKLLLNRVHTHLDWAAKWGLENPEHPLIALGEGLYVKPHEILTAVRAKLEKLKN